MQLLERHPEHKASIILEIRKFVEELGQEANQLGNDSVDPDDYSQRRDLLFSTYLTSPTPALTNDDITFFTTATSSHSNQARTGGGEAESDSRGIRHLGPDTVEGSDYQVLSSEYGQLDLSLVNQPPLFSLSDTALEAPDRFINPANMHRQPSSDRYIPTDHLSDNVGIGSDCGSTDTVTHSCRSQKRRGQGDIRHQTKRLRDGTRGDDVAQIQMTVSSRPNDLPRKAAVIIRTNDASLGSSQIEALLEARIGQKHPKHIQFLKHLFFTIGSPEVFVQLRAAVAIVRKRERIQIPSASSGIAGAVNALDVLEVGPFIASLVRRFCLQRLFEQRVKLRSDIDARRANLTRSTQEDDMSGDTRIQVITEMLNLAYPRGTEAPHDCAIYKTDKQRRKSLLNRLSSATNWHMLSSKFHIGILALVPQIQNQT